MSRFTILALSVLVVLITLPTAALAQPMVHRFYGTSTLEGIPPPIGSAVFGTVAGYTYITNTIDASGIYVLDIDQPLGRTYSGMTVTFRVRGYDATQTATWTAGGVTNLNLTALSATTPAIALASIAGKYRYAWGFDGRTQTWKLYDPLNPALSDLTVLERGKGYWILANENGTLIYSGNSYPIWKGWNLIGWLG
ncbi:MAG: hypothetical protein KJ624_03805 [Chloroflexi bacterium]|nr:hypothetical protein [Chloroflexota bacterium]